MKLRLLLPVAVLVVGSAGPIYASTDFLTGEQRVNGLKKICFYQGLRGASAITIASTGVCPLSQSEPMVPAQTVPRGGLNASIPLSVTPPVFATPIEQLAQIRAQREASALNQQQIALNASTLDALTAPPRSASDAKVPGWFDPMASEMIAEKQLVIDAQVSVIKTQADEISTLKRQLAAIVSR